MPSPELTEDPEAIRHSAEKKSSGRRSGRVSEASQAYREVLEVQKDMVRTLTEQNVGLAEERRVLEERCSQQYLQLQRLEQEIRETRRRPSTGVRAELQTLRHQAQELVDENDSLKQMVHRLTVELSHYQATFRPLSKHQNSRSNSLPVKGSPPPWLLDMKYLSPLLLAYEDRMSEKDSLLKAAEEELERLGHHVEEVVRENERLHKETIKTGGISHKEWRELQQQAGLVLKENQVLLEQLEAQQTRTRTSHRQHHHHVSRVSKQLMLLEEEKQHLQEELEGSVKEVQALRSRLEDAVTWEEHCSITSKLKRKAQTRMSVMKLQVEECVKKEMKARHFLSSMVSLAEKTSQEREQLIYMASALKQDKQGSLGRILEGTVRLGKLQEKIKCGQVQANLLLSPRGAVTHALAQTLAEAVDQADGQAGRHQADTGDAQGNSLDDQQVDAQGQGAEVEEAQQPHQDAGDVGTELRQGVLVVEVIRLEESREGLEEEEEEEAKLLGVSSTSLLLSELQDLSRATRRDMMLPSSGKPDTSYPPTWVSWRQKGQGMQEAPSAMLRILLRQREQTRCRQVYRQRASAGLEALEERLQEQEQEFAGRTASYHKEILHLHRLLADRQTELDRLLQHRQEIEEELELVWQAATRENQSMRESLLNSSPSGGLRGLAVHHGASPSWLSQAPEEDFTTSLQPQPPFTVHHSLPSRPHDLQRSPMFESDSDQHQNNSSDESEKHHLDFYS
ncbi:centrosomal protein of 89 kDa-like [Polymixia lowei]